MKQELLPTDLQGKILHVVEEFGEVLQAIGKAGRFGLQSYHPDKPQENNADAIVRELKDLKYAIERLEKDPVFKSSLTPRAPEGVYGDGEYM